MRRFTISSLLTTVLLLSGCSTKVEEYEGTKPNFELDRYFSGDVIAWGMVQDYSDKVTRRFCVEMTGTWQQGQSTGELVGELDEMFYYADGEVDQRIWQLVKSPSGEYSGSASDVTGKAKGEAFGFGFQWQYTLNLELDGTSYSFFLDDWMYQLDEYRMMNRTKMKNLGLPLPK